MLDVELMIENQEFLLEKSISEYVQNCQKPINKSKICTSCKEEIDPRRLEVLPSAIHCIDCANDIQSRLQFEKMLRTTRGVISNIVI